MKDEDRSIYSHLLASQNYVFLHEAFLFYCGDSAAILLSFLLKKEAEIIYNDKEFRPGDWFYFLGSEIESRLCFGEKKVTTSIKTLKDQEIVEVERKGIPYKNYYRLNYDKIKEIFLLHCHQKDGNGAVEKAGILPSKPPLLPKRVLLKRDREEIGLGFSSEKPKPPRRIINSKVMEMLKQAIPLGGFTNRLPGPGKDPTNTLVSVQLFLLSLRNNRICRDYSFDPSWASKNNICFADVDPGLDLTQVIENAVTNYSLMRKEGFWPSDKTWLTKDIGSFFYNPILKTSWFLYCVYNKPKPVQAVVENKRFQSLDLDKSTQDYVSTLKGENWDEAQFQKKVVSIYNWYEENKKELRIYNSYLSLSHIWIEYFNSFKAVLEQIQEFSSTWKDWNIYNFGHGNATWVRFVAWVKEKHQGLNIAPTPNQLERARTAVQRNSERLQSGKTREESEKEFEDMESDYKKKMLEQSDEEIGG
jgi:hypothetical protein